MKDDVVLTNAQHELDPVTAQQPTTAQGRYTTGNPNTSKAVAASIVFTHVVSNSTAAGIRLARLWWQAETPETGRFGLRQLQSTCYYD